MKKWIKGIGKFLLIWLVAFIAVGVVAAILNRPRWEKVSQFHRPGSRLVTISPELVVEAVDGKRYESCGENCWLEIPPGGEEIPADPLIISCLQRAPPPHLEDVISVLDGCESNEWGIFYRTCALTSSSIIYCWEGHRGGEFLAAIFGGCVFTLPIPFYGLIFVYAEVLSRSAHWVHKKISKSEQDNGDLES